MANTITGDGLKVNLNYEKMYSKKARESMSEKSIGKIRKSIPLVIIGERKDIKEAVDTKIEDLRDERTLISTVYNLDYGNQKNKRFKEIKNLTAGIEDDGLKELVQDYSNIIFPNNKDKKREEEVQEEITNPRNIVLYDKFKKEIEEERGLLDNIYDYITTNYKDTDFSLKALCLRSETRLEQDIFMSALCEEIDLCEDEEIEVSDLTTMVNAGGKIPYAINKITGKYKGKNVLQLSEAGVFQDLPENYESSDILKLKMTQLKEQNKMTLSNIENSEEKEDLSKSLKDQTYPPKELENKDKENIDSNNTPEKSNDNIEQEEKGI